jgi:hypothetical protein
MARIIAGLAPWTQWGSHRFSAGLKRVSLADVIKILVQHFRCYQGYAIG